MTSQTSTKSMESLEDDKQHFSDNIRKYCINSTANKTLIKEIVEIVKSYDDQAQDQIIKILYTTAQEVMYQLDMEATSHSETSLSEDPQEQADIIRRRNDRILPNNCCKMIEGYF